MLTNPAHTRGRPCSGRPRWRPVHEGRHGAEQPRRDPIYSLGARIRSGCRPSSPSRSRRSNSRSCLRPQSICRSRVTSHISLLVHCLNRMTQVLTELFDIGLLSPLSHTLAVSLFPATGPLWSMPLDVRSASCARSDHPRSPRALAARRPFPPPPARSTPCLRPQKGALPSRRLGPRAL